MLGFFKRKKDIKEIITNPVITVDYEDITPVADYFKNETGVTFDKQLSILKNKVITFCKKRELRSFSALLDAIEYKNDLKQELIDHLTTNETFFYREFKQIEELAGLVKKERKDVRILCAPSATGEEPYSIVIALLEAGLPKKSFQITGIDINQDAINRAKKAIYKERNIRNLPLKALDKYFTKNADEYSLKDIVKEHVDFKLLNIFDPAFCEIGKFDYIFSRNMLIYFDKETKSKAKAILESLRKNGDQEVFFGHADLF